MPVVPAAPPAHETRRRAGAILWIFFFAFVALMIVRFLVRRVWHVPAGDGLQYFQLAHELSVRHRFAFAPPPAPLAFSRLPGYPLFIALFGRPTNMEAHLVSATVLNQLLDVVTAGLVLGLAVERGLGARVGGLAALLVLGCPIIFYLSCYGLTESLTTCLVTAELYFAVRAMRRGSLRLAAGAGLFAGLAQLVRADAVAMVPAALAALCLADAPLRRRAAGVAAFALATAIVFSPWPIRNQARFGAMHAIGSSWEKQDGTEVPTGMVRWLRTWCTGSAGETYVYFLIANNRPLDMPRNLRPDMYDDEAEKKRVMSAFEHYNRRLNLEDANDDFIALAAERTRRHPARTWLTLPFKRMVTEWSPIPEWELPMRASIVHLPQARVAFGWFERALFVLGILGAVRLAVRDWRLVLIVALALVVRTALFAYAIPFPVERYMVEAMPGLLLLGAFAVFAIAAATRRASALDSP